MDTCSRKSSSVWFVWKSNTQTPKLGRTERKVYLAVRRCGGIQLVLGREKEAHCVGTTFEPTLVGLTFDDHRGSHCNGCSCRSSKSVTPTEDGCFWDTMSTIPSGRVTQCPIVLFQSFQFTHTHAHKHTIFIGTSDVLIQSFEGSVCCHLHDRRSFLCCHPLSTVEGAHLQNTRRRTCTSFHQHHRFFRHLFFPLTEWNGPVLTHLIFFSLTHWCVQKTFFGLGTKRRQRRIPVG